MALQLKRLARAAARAHLVLGRLAHEVREKNNVERRERVRETHDAQESGECTRADDCEAADDLSDQQRT